jgi:lipid A 3-O-deacylase
MQNRTGSMSKQISFDVLAHNVPVFGPQKEHGVDLNGEAQFASPVPRTWTADVAPRWRWLVEPRPTVGIEANTNGYASQIYGSLTWTADLNTAGVLWPDHTVFLGFGFGPAYNTGHVASRAGNRLSLGSNLLFFESLALGWRLTPGLSISGYFSHSSNAGLASHNDGVSNLGVRVGYHF